MQAIVQDRYGGPEVRITMAPNPFRPTQLLSKSRSQR